MTNAKPRLKRSNIVALAVLTGAAAALVLLTQRALAEQVGGWLAGVWVTTMAAVMGILGVFLGG